MKALRLVGSLTFVLGLFTTVFVGVPWHVLTSDDPVLPWWLKAALFCILGGVLLVLLTVAVETKRSTPRGEKQPEPHHHIPMLTSVEVPGRKTAETLGLVKGHTIFAIWLGKDLSALVRLVLGGELTEYTEMMGRARQVATHRMLAQAQELGADAIINVRYMTTSVIGSAAELLAYGTAVRLEVEA